MTCIFTEVPGVALLVDERSGAVYLCGVRVGMIPADALDVFLGMVRRAQRHPSRAAVQLAIDSVERGTVLRDLLEIDDQYRQGEGRL